MVRLFSAVVVILMISGLPGKCLGLDDYYYYDYQDYQNEPEENAPKLITGQQLKDIENVTQTTVIRLIERENRIMSKNMDDAGARCVEAAAVFENSCKSCGDGDSGGDSSDRPPSVLSKVLQYAEKLMKLHPIYWRIKIGEKIFKKLKRLRIRKIIQKAGKSIGQLAKNIGKAWRKLKKGISNVGRRIGRKLRRAVRRVGRVARRVGRRIGRKLRRAVRRVGRVARRVGRRLRRLARVRRRFRVRRIRIRRRRRGGRRRRRRRWGKRKRSSCDECQRISKITGDDDRAIATCPFLAAVDRESTKTDEFLEKLISEVENGYPRIQKIIHHPYKSTDEAVVTITSKEGSHLYTLKKFKKLSSTQAGRILGQYIFNRAKQ